MNAISGERCSPHPHVVSDRIMRPGDMAYYDIIHCVMGYRTCYYRTLNVGGATAKRARRVPARARTTWMPRSVSAEDGLVSLLAIAARVEFPAARRCASSSSGPSAGG